MSSLLDAQIVLVLNKNWQAINVTSPREVILQLVGNAATALDCRDGNLQPTPWNEWLKIEPAENDRVIRTPQRAILIPTVVILQNYSEVPKVAPHFSPRNIWERDGGVCQYTGRKLSHSEGNIDHVIPVSRGGATSWDNCVLADKRVNSRKAAQTPEEAGLTLLKSPVAPRRVPVTCTIRNPHGIPEWDMFLRNS